MENAIVESNSLFEMPCHWVLAVALGSVDIESKQIYLIAEERQHCARFRKTADRDRYILAHALKRYCLARYLNVSPSELVFSKGAKGKPYCVLDGAPAFNLSHSGQYVLLGLSALAHIGVDVEPFDRAVSPNIFPKVLTSSQQQQVHASSEPSYEFMCYWTQKEAISKALGLGLSIDFTTIECSGVEGEFDTHHSSQQLLVATRQWDSQHIISVASTINTPLKLFQLKAWDLDFVVEDRNRF